MGDSEKRQNSILGSLIEGSKDPRVRGIPLIVDLAFASNVRFLDEHELHLNDIELYKVTRQHLKQRITIKFGAISKIKIINIAK